MTLTVKVVPKAAIAFGAKYADGNYGAAPPWGKGYGGSDHGMADDNGSYTTSWTVAPTAPVGGGQVEVLASAPGGQGSAQAPFVVSGADGSCAH